MSMEPLKRLGKYELRERLGHGGMAEVWKAFDTQLKRYVAIKILHPKLLEDPNFVTRFELEAQLIASLHHPNIVQIHDFQVSHSPESDRTFAYMVMAYIEGGTLSNYIGQTSAQGKIPSPVEIVNLFTSISLAVDYAHGLGMVHRDIKPANILLDKNNTARNAMGEPILTDFGLAKLLGVSASTFTANQLGTPLYTSPEQARGYAGNERSDLYSLGVILYEMVTGVQPFRGTTPIEVLSQHLNATPTSPVLLNPNIPPALTMVIVTALAKDPNARFSSAATMTAAIAESLKVPVPEVLGQPAYPQDFQNMPTYIGAPISQAGINLSPSSSPSLAFSSPAALPTSSGPGAVAPVHATPQISTPGSPAAWQSGPVSLSGVPTELARSQNISPARAGAIQDPPLSPTGLASAPATAAKPPSTAPKRKWKGWYTALIVVVIAALLISGLSAFLVVHNRNAQTPVLPGGQAFFLSTGQLNPHTSQGIADQIEIDLHAIPNPQAGKSYYAWLLADRLPTAKQDVPQPRPLFTLPLLLGKLRVVNGNVNFFYPGTTQHDDLFALASRLLITEEDTNGTPRGPSANRSAWVYYAQSPETRYSSPPLSALDHIRHLFYKETVVDVLGLSGGLDNWLYKNTEKVMEWSISARDDYHPYVSDPGIIKNLFISILDYLDGAPNVHIDVPGGPVVADQTISQVALLTVDPAVQNKDLAHNPPGYLAHIQLHLQGVVGAPDATPQMRQLASNIIHELHNANVWLNNVRADAQKLVKMNAVQLAQPSTQVLLDDMLKNATYAYIGQLNPSTNQVVQGVLQVHYDIQKLAALTITPTLPQSI